MIESWRMPQHGLIIYRGVQCATPRDPFWHCTLWDNRLEFSEGQHTYIYIFAVLRVNGLSSCSPGPISYVRQGVCPTVTTTINTGVDSFEKDPFCYDYLDGAGSVSVILSFRYR